MEFLHQLQGSLQTNFRRLEREDEEREGGRDRSLARITVMSLWCLDVLFFLYTFWEV
jgi:hypothetical protein